MRKVIVSEFLSLDGVMQAPGAGSHGLKMLCGPASDEIRACATQPS